MSNPPDALPPRVSWKTIERVAAKADAERLEAMSEAELDDELRKAGLTTRDADRVARRALRERGQSRWGVALVVAAAAVLLVVLAWKRREVVAFVTGTPEPIGPDQSSMPVEPSRRAQADRLRGEAFVACGQARWEVCRGKLDVARALDPAGEAAPGVVQARDSIAAAADVDVGPKEGPKGPR